MKEIRWRRIVNCLAVCLLSVWMGAACELEGDDVPPGRITDLHFFDRADALQFQHRVSEVAAAGLANTRLLAWTAPGDDGFDGQASLYYLKYMRAADLARFSGTDAEKKFLAHWDEARNLTGEPYPRPGGFLEQVILPQLAMGDSIWIALSSADETGQESPVSNVLGPLRLGRLSIAVRPAPGSTVAGFGESLAGAGDFNGDGLPDLLLASPAEGKVYLVLGRKNADLIKKLPNTQGINTLRAITELTPVFSIAGNTAEYFGFAVSSLFRINSDSLADVAVSAPAADPGGRLNAGAVFIKYGSKNPPAVLSASSVDVVLAGQAAGDSFGFSLVPGFDLNQDTRNEFIVGAPGAFSGRGAVYIFKAAGLASGDAGTSIVEIRGESVGDHFGAVVSSLGDVNGDLIPDFGVAAPERTEGGDVAAGAVYVFYGGNAGVIKFSGLDSGRTVIDLASAKADVTIRGTGAGRRLGKKITASGNLAGDNDGAHDFALAGGETVYVFFGGANQPLPFPRQSVFGEGTEAMASVILEGTPGEGFGAALIGPGNLNRDAADDLVVGAPAGDRCYVFLGPLSTGQKAEVIFAPAAGKRFGSALAGVGDFNSDGFVDLLLAAPLAGEAYFSF